MSLLLVSPDFGAGGNIPAVHTCDGSDTSPALSWSGLPPGTKSLALIIDDPDAPDPAAPQTTWVHWVLYNIPASSTGLPASVRGTNLPPGTRRGLNDWKKSAYGGPCPPVGRSAGTVMCTSSTHWMWNCPISGIRPRRIWKKRCAITCWRRAN